MNHKQKLSTLLALSLMGTAGAMAQSHLSVYLANGMPVQSFALADVGRITFDQTSMLITHQGEATAIDLSTLKAIRFDDGVTTAVGAVSVPSGGIRLVSGSLSAPGWQGARGLRVYSATGQLLLHKADWAGESVSLAALPHGTYIVKTASQTLKFSK